MEKIYYSYNQFIQDLKKIAPILKQQNFDTVLAISRGGLTISHFISEFINLRDVKSLNAISYNGTQKLEKLQIFGVPTKLGAKTLIVDDISDSGKTLFEVNLLLKKRFPNIDFKYFTIFYGKNSKFKPNFFCKNNSDWIDFFWEVDLKN